MKKITNEQRQENLKALGKLMIASNVSPEFKVEVLKAWAKTEVNGEERVTYEKGNGKDDSERKLHKVSKANLWVSLVDVLMRIGGIFFP